MRAAGVDLMYFFKTKDQQRRGRLSPAVQEPQLGVAEPGGSCWELPFAAHMETKESIV